MGIPNTIEVVKTADRGNTIVTKEKIKKGEIIFSLEGKLVSQKDTRKPIVALQIDDTLFLESTAYFDDNLNHSCEPNCFIDFEHLNVVALKNIPAGSELSFNYNSSDYDLIDQRCAFICHCGTEQCMGRIKGFKYLPLEQKKKIKKILSPFLKRKLKQELMLARATAHHKKTLSKQYVLAR